LLEELAMLRGAALASLALLLTGSGVASAQVAAGGLGTRVNGTALGRCSVGVCSVQGGSAAGPNLFHRFSQFDTRAGIQRVELDSRGRSNVVVGVSHPNGSFFGAPLRLSGAANLFWLSPGGLWLGNGARFQGATSLLLSTAPSLRIGGGAFNAVGGLADRLGAGADAPSLDIEALARGGLTGDTLATGSGAIVLAGGRLTVDRHLLLHSGVGPIRSEPGSVGTTLKAGGSVQLSGGPIALQGLDAQAGTGSADDLVRIRSGPVAGGGLGRLELTGATLNGASVQLEGAGGLALQQVEARSGGAAGPGGVQLDAGESGDGAVTQLRNVRLTGGDVRVRSSGPLEATDLRAEANGSSGRLELRSGAGPAGEASLRLNKADLEGSGVVIAADGPGDLRFVRIRAGGPDGSGAVLLRTGSAGGATTATRLDSVTLSGGDVWLRSTGPLTARNLRMAAGEAGGPGRLQLEAGEATATDPSLRLDQPDLQGRSVVIRATGASQLRRGEVRVPMTVASQGDEGQLFLSSRPGAAGSPSPLLLEDMRLSAQQVVVSAAGDLVGRDLQVQADQIWLAAEGILSTGNLQLEGPSRLTARQLNARASLDLTAEGLSATTDSLLFLKAGRRLTLANSELLVDTRQGQILLDALAPMGLDRRGQLELRSSRLEGATLTAQADESLTLENVTARGGAPGHRGQIRLMTAPTRPLPDKADPDAGSRGELRLAGGTLEAGSVILRSGAIEGNGIQITAPKGKIHLEAKAGALTLRGSRLDVGVSLPEDLRTEVDLWGIPLLEDSTPNTPSIGLFSKGNLSLLDGSLLRTTQDLAPLRQARRDPPRSEIRLTDTSGMVVADAGQTLSLQDSAIEADASDNLAGNILLRSRAAEGEGGLELRRVSLSASGGVGSGDIRLNSAQGIRITDSTLAARSTHSPEDPDNPGQASWERLVNGLGIGAFQGGEITLTNTSAKEGISITNSQLRAEQSGSDGGLSMYNLSGRSDPLEWVDAFDDSDRLRANLLGGLISIFSGAGLTVTGETSLLSASGMAGSGSPPDVFGGMIRLVNTARTHPLEISGGARLESISGPGSQDSSGKPATGGMVNAWSSGPILISNATLDTHTEVPDDDPLSAYFQGGIALYSQEPISLQESTLRLGGFSGGGEGLGELTLVTPQEPAIAGSTLFPACEGSCVWSWNEDRFRSFLQGDEAPNIWGPYRRINANLAPEIIDSFFRIKDEYFTGNANGSQSFAEVVRNWPDQIPERQVSVLGQPAIPLSDIVSTPGRGSGRSFAGVSPADLAAPPPTPLLTLSSEATGPLAYAPPMGTLGKAVLAPISLVPPASPGREGTTAMASNAAAESFLRHEQNASQDVIAALGLPRRTPPKLAIGDLQKLLRQSLAVAGQRLAQPSTAAPAYVPAIVQISLSTPIGSTQTQINHILIPAQGEIRGWQTRVATTDLQASLRGFQRQLSQQESLEDGEAGRRLAALLVNPLWPEWKAQGINAVLLSLDRGLQGIPFAALPLADGLVVDHMAITITPALGLTNLEPEIGPPQRRRTVLAGASHFSNGLSPLTMAEQELRRLASLHADSLILLDRSFQTRTLLERARERPVEILHLATHADFASLRADGARIYTSDGTLSLAELGQQLRQGQTEPLALFVLNACRTAVGNEDKELGIAGLALQAGASAALGNLWFVDDVATAAFSVQFHRALQQGMGKDQALQRTQLAFRSGRLNVRGTDIVDDQGEVVISNLNPSDQQRLRNLTHPYFWAGVILTGRPW
jgi:CHAT domain-containing protein